MTVPVPPEPRAEPRCIYCGGPLGDFDLYNVCIRCNAPYTPDPSGIEEARGDEHD